MSATIHTAETGTPTNGISAECIKAIGILTNDLLPTEIRTMILEADFMQHLTSSIAKARSPLFLALKKLVTFGAAYKLHQQMYFEIMEIWEKKQNTTFLVDSAYSLRILDHLGRQERLAIKHLVFNRHRVYEYSPPEFPPDPVGKKITISNSLKTICICLTKYDLLCIGLGRDIGVRLQYIIPAAKKTLEKVVIELAPGFVYESRPDQLEIDFQHTLHQLDSYISSRHVLEQGPNGALFLTWSAPFDPFPAR